jgi:hypothetical protein
LSNSQDAALVAEGKAIWDTQCTVCHNDFDDQGQAVPTLEQAIRNGYPPDALSIDAVDAITKPFSSIEDYIYANMPPYINDSNGFIFSDELCDEDCSYKVAYYIFDVGFRAAEPEQTGAAFGEQSYEKLGCVDCHGNNPLNSNLPINLANYSLDSLKSKIENTMPLGNSNDAWKRCIGNCAASIADYLWGLRPEAVCDNGEKVLPRRVRALSRFEYTNTVNDLFAISHGDALAANVVNDPKVEGFDNNADANIISLGRMEGYFSAAEAVAAGVDASPWLTTDNCAFNTVASCFVANFGLRAFRRPLTADEQTRYVAIFALGADNQKGAQNVIHGMLISPNFLYRSELGVAGTLTPYEVATLLSYTFWGSAPDLTLLDLAANNQLATQAQLEQVVATLIADPKAERQFVHFGRQWLQVEPLTYLERDPDVFPMFTSDVRQAMDLELELFFAEMFLQDGHDLDDLFTWDQTFANVTLANYYGLTGATEETPTKIAAGSQRGGVLKLGAVSAQYAKFGGTHPVARGLLVRRNLLCQDFGAPPPGIVPVATTDPNNPDLTLRQRLAAHSQNAACASCHKYIDDLGFAFENYNAAGMFDTSANLDSSGVISGLNLLTGADSYAFNGLSDLSDILATEGRQAVGNCLVRRAKMSMEGQAKPGACGLSNIVANWNPETQSLKNLWVQLVVSQSFSQRQ